MGDDDVAGREGQSGRKPTQRGKDPDDERDERKAKVHSLAIRLAIGHERIAVPRLQVLQPTVHGHLLLLHALRLLLPSLLCAD